MCNNLTRRSKHEMRVTEVDINNKQITLAREGESKYLFIIYVLSFTVYLLSLSSCYLSTMKFSFPLIT